ncbi:MAG: hybrid sensor histidine kinase/response regulator, partial [Saprospiraceae bacterium]|nr:hybrid sensor histidine kinase/response regulator [Saprospiraceae bacterium]
MAQKIDKKRLRQAIEINNWNDSEINDLRERSLKLSLWLLIIVSWASSFWFWETGRLQNAGFFGSSLIVFLLAWVVYFKKGQGYASWVCMIGTMISISIEVVLTHGTWMWILFMVPILQAGIFFGSLTGALVGFLEILLVIVLDVNLDAQIPLNPLLFYLAGTTAIVWYTSRQIYISLYQTMFYAVNTKIALEEARDHRGRLVRMVKSLDENTVRLVKAYDNILQLQLEAEQARQQKIQFVNMLSHEMRAPLNFIIGATELMANSPKAYGEELWPSGLHEDIQRVYQSSQHLLDLINDVLTLGKIESNRMGITFGDYPLTAVFDEVIMIIGAAFEINHLYLDIQIEPDLPELSMDKIRIRQVLLNLISNSLRHTKKGGVSIRAKKDGDNILVSVEDTGSGISPENLPNLIQDFFEGDQNSQDLYLSSNGLGLSISKQFIDLHGGRIWAESPIQEPHNEEGPGSRFFFSLPLEGINQLHSFWIGQNETYLTRRAAQPVKKGTLIVYSTDSCLPPGQLLVDLSGYQLAQCINENELRHGLLNLNPCGVIQLCTDSSDPSISHLSPHIPFIKCNIQIEKLNLADYWDGYITKPSTPDRILNMLRSLNIKPRTCVVVDDDPDVWRFFELTYLSAGLNVDLNHAKTGEKGLEIIQSLLPDVVFLDINLPDTSGWVVLQQIRDIPQTSDMPVIIFSAADNPNPMITQLYSLELSYA